MGKRERQKRNSTDHDFDQLVDVVSGLNREAMLAGRHDRLEVSTREGRPVVLRVMVTVPAEADMPEPSRNVR